ncbi:MAG: type IV pilus modification protein PilV [Halioglobus sp.]|nr:type IV pilus modification protein PilV [Halioglobus sp.]
MVFRHRVAAARPALNQRGPSFVLRGAGLLEFLIALLIFSTGMTGVMAAQLASKRAMFDARQQSVAAALAADMLARIAANPSQVTAYAAASAGDAENARPEPAVNCHHSLCTPEQLVLFDLWLWEGALLGAAATDHEVKTGGLIAPRACFQYAAPLLTLTLSWRSSAGSFAGESTAMACGSLVEGVYDAGDAEAGNNRLARQLQLSSFVPGSP